MNLSFIDIAYNLAKKEYGNKEFAFSELFSKLSKSLHWTKKESDSNIGEFYANLMQDRRFIFCGKNNWCLSEYLNLKQKADLNSKLYENNSTQVFEEGYEQPLTSSSDIQKESQEYEQSSDVEEEKNEVSEYTENEDEEDETSYEDYEDLLKNQADQDEGFDDEWDLFSNR